MDPDQALVASFHRFVGEVTTSPLYQAMCPILAETPAAIDLYSDTPKQQRRPNLLLASMHASLLRDPDHELATWHATLGGIRRPDDPRLADAVRDLIAARTAELRDAVTHGATQTNEVGRSAILLPALAEVGAATGRPLGLVEIGASAGLNLRLDRYGYRYTAPHADVAVGDPASPVQITCDVSRSPERIDTEAIRALRIASRRGIDLNPLDPTDPDQARWLAALIWPDEVERFRRLRAALELAGSFPVQVTAGDAVDDVAAGVAEVPDHEHPIVITTWVLTYLPGERRRAFVAAVDAMGAQRDLTWLCVEHPGYAPTLPFPDAVLAAGDLGGANPVVAHEYRRGEVDRRWIATTHPHGRWLRWHADAGQLPH